MCGIAAILSYGVHAPAVDREELINIRDAMSLRGPDSYGEWLSPNGRVCFGHRRLSVIDLSSAGVQPMKNQDGTLVVIFNGEIYNYRELRSRLEQKGHEFRSTSDTEVLLHLYAEKGEQMVHDLRGMYAFVIWDSRKRFLFAARDPYGIKPLYYADDGQTLRVASQVKALIAGGRIDTSPEPAGHVGFFLWGHVPEPFTLHRGIRALASGTYLRVTEYQKPEIIDFCRIPDLMASAERNALANPATQGAQLREALEETVRHHLIADVPVGLFLSSGLDSTTLAVLASKETDRLRTVTLGFDEFRNTQDDEVPLAELTAKKYGFSHETIWVTRADFQSHLNRIFEAMDQPSIDGINTYFVSLAAVRASLKVAISGLGGDELFGGYPSFLEIPRLVQALRHSRHFPISGHSFRVLAYPVLKRLTSPKYAGLLEYGGSYAGAYLLKRGMFMPWELPEVLDGDMVREGWNKLESLVRLDETVAGLRSERLKITSLESCWYMRNQLLRDSDWASMAHSLELRVPLVDTKLLTTIVPMLAADAPPDKLQMAMTASLPTELLHRKKTGFRVPVREWIMGITGGTAAPRGLRGWARYVYSRFHQN